MIRLDVCVICAGHDVYTSAANDVHAWNAATACHDHASRRWRVYSGTSSR